MSSAPLFAASCSWFGDQGLFPGLAGEGSHLNDHAKTGVASQIPWLRTCFGVAAAPPQDSSVLPRQDITGMVP